jgi:two-component system cell cycle sensor histidine kinase/response regulator CckA
MIHSLSAAIVAALPDAIVSIDRTSTVIHVNEAAEALFGFPAAEFIGRTLAETIIPPELSAQHDRGMARFAATGHGPVINRRIDIVARNRTGRRFPIELGIFLDPERRGEIFHAVIRDVSDRVARDSAGKNERDRLELFLDATADAWWDCAVGGETRYAERMSELLGVGEGALPSCEPSRLPWIHTDDRARVEDAWEAYLDGHVGRFECTLRVVGRDGAVRWLRQRGRAVEFDGGRPTRIVGTATDITEQQATEELLRNSQRLEMLGLLAGGFAHDLNNLLAAIRGQAALAATEPGTAPAVLESLEAIQLATTKAKMLSLNMLALGKPRDEEVRRFPLCASIEETMQLARIGLPKSIRVSVDVSAATGIDIEMDPGAFQQAILNLAINARDAMGVGGSLRVDAHPIAPSSPDGRDPSRVCITVTDSGCGISPEVLARIFEPFFTTKPKGVGTGLGLAVVHQAITGAHGRVRVESEVGRGTRFIIELPALPSAEPATVGMLDQVGSLHVVVAEDHPLLRPMLAEALRAGGHTVVDVGDGTAALKAAVDPSFPVDLLVLDVLLPGMDGFRIHARAEEVLGRAIGCVFVSGDPATVLPPGSPTRVCLLPKPFEISTLLEAVRRVTRASTAQPN